MRSSSFIACELVFAHSMNSLNVHSRGAALPRRALQPLQTGATTSGRL
jgi:hypothetical protein